MNADTHSLAAAYALDALDADERDSFEEHLRTCDDCAEEVRGFAETAARLGAAAEATPPEHLRASVLDLVARTPQDRPVVASLDEHRSRRRGLARALLAAAVAAVVVGLAGWGLVERDRADDLAAEQAAVTAVLSAPDASMTTQDVTGGGTARVVVSEDRGDAVMVVAGLPELDDDHDYQLWTLEGDEPSSAGVLDREDQGADVASTRLVSELDGVTAMAITVEPAGGSETPTTNPIVAIPTA